MTSEALSSPAPSPAIRARAERALLALEEALAKPFDGAALAVFRVAFGVLVAVSAVRFFAYGWIDEFIAKPSFVFSYYGASFVSRPSREGLFALFFALFLSGVAVAIGLFYRVAIVALFLAFTWIELLDVTNYLNHYYLVSLLALLLAFMPLGEVYGVDALLARRRTKGAGSNRTTFPAWMTYLLRFQVAVVYFYAGLAKVTGDWLLHAQPLNIWLSARTSTPFIGALLDERAVAYFFSWAGFLFDTTIAFFLLVPRARPFAYVAVVFFHVMTSMLFPIGMFPFIMMLAALVFFSPSWPRKVLGELVSVVGKISERLAVRFASLASRVPPARDLRIGPPASRPTTAFTLGLGVFVLYAAFQILFPLRHRLYGGNVLWHEQGMRFSWKVMVREKNASASYRVRDLVTSREWEVHPRSYLDRRQEREFATQPDLVLRLAHAIHDDESKRSGHDVAVFADVVASLNGRPAERLIDPSVDLARETDGFAPKRFILPAPVEAPPHLRPLR